jgi:hypothetical protein
MVILSPWKPVALVLGLLSASLLVSYFGSALMRGKVPLLSAPGIGSPRPRIMPNEIPQAQSPIACRSESIINRSAVLS